METINEKMIDQIHYKVNEIIDILNGMPVIGKPVNADGVIDMLNFLRLLVKYERFDLEACRRELRFLRNLVEELRGGDENGC